MVANAIPQPIIPLPKRRAVAAFNAVNDIMTGNDNKLKEDYQQLAKSAPADIQSNGLGQTLAFWKAKGDPEKLALLEDVNTWLRGEIGFTLGDVVKWIIVEASSQDYRRATAETIAFLVWVKRFADGYLP